MDERQPKVSIVMSTYNRPAKLKKAIESVINQTYTDWELIVVHDGDETDENHIVLPNEAPLNTEVIYIPHFGNDTKPKNKGILESTGEYIAFLDDDNQFRPDHLQVLVNALEKDPKVDAVYGDRWIIDEDENYPSQLGFTADFISSNLFIRNFIDTSDVLIRRKALFEVGGFDERYKKYVDWNLWLRLAKAGKTFKRIPVVITDYYLHKDQKSQTVQDKMPDGSPSVPLGAAPTINPEWDPQDLEIELPYLGEIPEPRVAIYTLTYNRLEYTKKTFESMQKTAGYPFDHFVVDNGSEDGTVEYLKENYPKVTIISNEVNKGISIASNQAIDAIKHYGNTHQYDYDVIMKVDNDCLFLTQDWLKTMIKVWKTNHRIALSCYVQGLRDNPGGAPRLGNGTAAGVYLGITKHLGGICHFVDADAYEDFRWDEDSFLHGIQDLEFSQYLRLKGYLMGYMENFFCEHMEGTEGQHKRYPEYFKKREIEKQTRYGKED